MTKAELHWTDSGYHLVYISKDTRRRKGFTKIRNFRTLGLAHGYIKRNLKGYEVENVLHINHKNND